MKTKAPRAGSRRSLRKFRTLARGLALAALMALIGLSSARAASVTWKSNATGSVWTDVANWVGGAVPTNDLYTDTVTFPTTFTSGSTGQPIVDNAQVYGIKITTYSGQGLNLTGTTLGIGAGGGHGRRAVQSI